MCGSGTDQCAPCKKKFVDSRLRKAASLYANLGTEPTADERLYAKQKEIELLTEIREVDVELSNRLLNKED